MTETNVITDPSLTDGFARLWFGERSDVGAIDRAAAGELHPDQEAGPPLDYPPMAMWGRMAARTMRPCLRRAR